MSATARRAFLTVLVALVMLSFAAFAQTASATNPTVTTSAATGVGDQTSTLNGNLAAMGAGSTLVKVGFRWGTSATLTTYTNVTVGTKTGTGTFSHSLTGLSLETKYYFRAWARNFTGSVERPDFALGSILNFTTTNVLGNAMENVVSLVTNLLVALIPLFVIVGAFTLILGIFVGKGGMFTQFGSTLTGRRR